MRNEKKKEGNGHDDNCGIGSHVFAVSNFKRGSKAKKKNDCTHVSVADLYTRIHPSQLVFLSSARLPSGWPGCCLRPWVRTRARASVYVSSLHGSPRHVAAWLSSSDRLLEVPIRLLQDPCPSSSSSSSSC